MSSGDNRRLGLLRSVVRLLSSQDWMPSIETNFVIQRLIAAREQAWQDYEAVRYGDRSAEPDGNLSENPAQRRLRPASLPAADAGKYAATL